MTTSRHLLGICILVLVIVAGCGDDAGSPTAPTAPQFPQVAGTYAGPLTITSSNAPQEPLIGSAQLNVVQAGSQLTITGSITLFGVTQQLPAVTGMINETGFFTASAGGFSSATADAGDCGIIRETSSTLTFSGSTARLHESATTDFCGNLTMDGTLNR